VIAARQSLQPRPVQTVLARHRGRLACRRLVLTHMSQAMLARRADIEAETAFDGLTLTI
jgi:hypothetical protein